MLKVTQLVSWPSLDSYLSSQTPELKFHHYILPSLQGGEGINEF